MTAREELEQIAIISWAARADIHYHDLIHVPNGGSRNILEGVKFKKMGVRKGVCDLMLLIPKNGFHALFVELKRPKKKGKHIKVYPDQRDFLKRKNEQGYKSVVCYGADEAIEEIKKYLA